MLVGIAAIKSLRSGKSAPNPSHREDITMELTRRHALAGAAALAAAPLLPTMPARLRNIIPPIFA